MVSSELIPLHVTVKQYKRNQKSVVFPFHTDDPNSLRRPISLLHFFFFYSLAVLCLDSFVNLTYMACKTELS